MAHLKRARPVPGLRLLPRARWARRDADGAPWRHSESTPPIGSGCPLNTSADAAWAQLQVWRDVNQDGVSQSGELSGLDALGITRIGLNGSGTGPQAGQTINNNTVALSAMLARGGVERTVGAIDLGAQALPQMNGSGMVRNLRAAMSLAGTQADELEAAVAQMWNS